jgi:hypothetical protein
VRKDGRYEKLANRSLLTQFVVRPLRQSDQRFLDGLVANFSIGWLNRDQLHVTFPRLQSISPSRRQKQMAKRSAGFNLSATIREFQKSHRGVPATAALEAVKKAHPSQKVNEGTFKATFYKLAGGGKRKVVKRRKPGRVVAGSGGNHAESIMKAGLHFIVAAGGVEEARERLVGLAELIETAKEVE